MHRRRRHRHRISRRVEERKATDRRRRSSGPVRLEEQTRRGFCRSIGPAMSAPRYLHVANGTSVTMTLEAAGVPGIMSIWADPLHDGPVPAGLTDDELRELRGGHLGGGAVVNPVNDMRRW